MCNSTETLKERDNEKLCTELKELLERHEAIIAIPKRGRLEIRSSDGDARVMFSMAEDRPIDPKFLYNLGY